MPTYEYSLPTMDRTFEVRHGMNERLETWGELCDAAGVDPGDTPRETPIKRLMSASAVRAAHAAPDPSACARSTGHGGGCCGGMCGMG